MSLRFTIITFLLITNFDFHLTAQEKVTADPSRYDKIKYVDIQALVSNIEVDPRSVVQELNQKLNDFYIKDTATRKIQNEQLVNFNSPYKFSPKQEFNINLKRLFMRSLLSQKARKHHIDESPNLYFAHYTLAKAYQKLNKPYKAAYHFATSLRYRSLRLSTDVYLNKHRLKNLDSNNMQKVFATAYRSNLKKLNEAENKLKRNKILAVVLADNLRGQSYSDRRLIESAIEKADKENQAGSVSLSDALKKKMADLIAKQLATDKANIKKILTNTKKEINKITEQLANYKKNHENNVKTYHQIEKKYNRASSKFLLETSVLVKTLENAVKERQKVLNKKVLYKTSFNQTMVHDYSQNRQFTAYANLLEMASRLDPEDPHIPVNLADEYRTSRLKDRAIYAYKKSLAVNKNASPLRKLKEKKVSHIYMSLGGLYFQNRKYVPAAENYEAALKLATDEKKRRSLTFQLIKMHTKKTGRFRRAEVLAKEFLKPLENKNPTVVSSRLAWIKSRFHTYSYLSEVYQKTSNPSEQFKSLQKAYEAYNQLEIMLKETKQKIYTTDIEVQKAKVPLFEETKDDDLSLYYRKQAQLDELKALLSDMRSVRRSFPLRNLYFAMADYWRNIHEPEKAKAIYREAEIRGIAAEEARRLSSRLSIR